MKETKLHPCYCGGEMKIEKMAINCGMDGIRYDWQLTCSECGLTKTYAADDFYGRKYKTFEEVVDDWNSQYSHKADKETRLDKTISDVGYTLDCLVLLRKIMEMGDCNVCANKDCEYMPKPGQMVRYNCPFYKAEKEDEE